jgi:hypothetical protein
MEKLVFNIMTDKGGFTISLNNSEKEYEFYSELLIIFCVLENEKYVLEEVQYLNTELINKMNTFIEKWKKQNGYVNRINTLFEKLTLGEALLVIPHDVESTNDLRHYELLLSCLNKTETEEEANDLFKIENEKLEPFIGELFRAYNIVTKLGNNRVFVGDKDKKIRCCRFCTRGVKDGAKFSNDAHAIPHALGNNTIFLYNECDLCNSYFGDHIEPCFIEFFDIQRVMLEIKGKKKKKDGLTIKYDNGQVSKNDNMTVVMTNKLTVDPDNNLTAELQSNKNFSSSKFYKTLCKMALSVVDNEWIDKSRESIKWLRYDDEEVELPKIATCINNNVFTKTAKLNVYTRISDDKKLPLIVGEFGLWNYVYVFIVPFTSNTDSSFIDDSEYKYFWDFFKIYSLNNGWSFKNYSSIHEHKINYKMVVKKSDKSEDLSLA